MISQVIDINSGYIEDQNGQLSNYPTKVYDMGLIVAIGTIPISLPAVCIIRASLNLLYDKKLEKDEDFDLWIRCFVKGFLKIKVLKTD